MEKNTKTFSERVSDLSRGTYSSKLKVYLTNLDNYLDGNDTSGDIVQDYKVILDTLYGLSSKWEIAVSVFPDKKDQISRKQKDLALLLNDLSQIELSDEDSYEMNSLPYTAPELLGVKPKRSFLGKLFGRKK